VLSRKGDFLNKDFRFEIVFTIKKGDKITFVGIGEADPNSTYREPKNSVYLRFHPPDMGGGEVDLSNAPSQNLVQIGKVTRYGTHRVMIEKKGEALTFTIDPDNDGPSDDDIQKTIPSLKEVGPFLNSKNTFIFFGAGGTTFKQLRLVE